MMKMSLAGGVPEESCEDERGRYSTSESLHLWLEARGDKLKLFCSGAGKHRRVQNGQVTDQRCCW